MPTTFVATHRAVIQNDLHIAFCMPKFHIKTVRRVSCSHRGRHPAANDMLCYRTRGLNPSDPSTSTYRSLCPTTPANNLAQQPINWKRAQFLHAAMGVRRHGHLGASALSWKILNGLGKGYYALSKLTHVWQRFIQDCRETLPYDAADARHVDFPKFVAVARGAPMVVDIDGVRQGVSELLQAVYTKPWCISCGFAAVLKLNFGFHNFGERGWAFVVTDGASVTSYRSHYKGSGVCYGFCRRV